MKIDIRCGMSDGGGPHGKELGAIQRQDLDFAAGRFTFQRLRWDERDYTCDKHGALQIHDEDLLRLALKPRKRYSIMARSVRRMVEP